MPAEWMDPVGDDDNHLTMSLELARLNCLMEEHEFERAKEFILTFMAKYDKMLGIYKKELQCELLFFELIGERRTDEIDRLYTKELKKYINASRSQLSKCRLMYAYAKLVSKNETESKKALDRFNKASRRTPFKGEIELERELVEIIDDVAEKMNTASQGSAEIEKY
jgi:CRISPR/Cas system-associated exonuclease Cas4 (RecB family)